MAFASVVLLNPKRGKSMSDFWWCLHLQLWLGLNMAITTVHFW